MTADIYNKQNFHSDDSSKVVHLHQEFHPST